MSFQTDVLGFNQNNNIFCNKRVMVGNPNSTETGTIDFIGINGREVSINGVVPTGGGGSLPADATFDNLTINTSVVNNGTQSQLGKITTNDIDCNGNILLAATKNITADNITATVNLGTTNLGTTNLTTTGVNNLGGAFTCSSVPANFIGGLAVDAGITVNTGNCEIGTGQFIGASSNLTGGLTATNISCTNGTEGSRFLMVPRLFLKASGGWGLQQAAAGSLVNDLQVGGSQTTGGRVICCKGGGNSSLDANQNLIVEDTGVVRVATAVDTPKIAFAKDSSVTSSYSIFQPPPNPDPELIIKAPTAGSMIIFVDELDNPIVEIEKDSTLIHKDLELHVNTGVTPITIPKLMLGNYEFYPIQLTRTITNYAIVTTTIPATITQAPIFVTGSLAGVTNDWLLVNTEQTGLTLSAEGFYKITLTGDSVASVPPYMNNFACMFDFCLRTAQDNAPRITIPVNSFSFNAIEPNPTTVGSVPIITCTPSNTNWSVYINFPTFPAMTIPNLVIKVTKMPY